MVIVLIHHIVQLKHHHQQHQNQLQLQVQLFQHVMIPMKYLKDVVVHVIKHVMIQIHLVLNVVMLDVNVKMDMYMIQMEYV